MKTTSPYSFPLRRAALMALPLLLTSCFEKDKDEEPTQGNYRVKVTPESGQFAPGIPATFTVQLSVLCEGQNLPANCGANQPMWVAEATRRSFSVQIADPTQAITTATVTWHGSPPEEGTSLASDSGTVYFTPSRTPQGLKAGTDAVLITLPDSAPEAETESAGTPGISAFPGQAFFGRNAGSQSLNFIYKGPDTQVTAITISGDPKFTLGAAPLISLKSGQSVPVTVNYAGASDSNPYTALVTVTTANGATATAAGLGQ